MTISKFICVCACVNPGWCVTQPEAERCEGCGWVDFEVGVDSDS